MNPALAGAEVVDLFCQYDSIGLGARGGLSYIGNVQTLLKYLLKKNWTLVLRRRFGSLIEKHRVHDGITSTVTLLHGISTLHCTLGGCLPYLATYCAANFSASSG